MKIGFNIENDPKHMRMSTNFDQLPCSILRRSNPKLKQYDIVVKTEPNHTVKNRTGATGLTFLSSSLNNSLVATVNEWED